MLRSEYAARVVVAEVVHLRSIRLRGFKSFAKPTELMLEPGVTVIIGPNGSGKSNIADAVLWVLGEQSPGNLRGRTMQDVIFSGAGGRKSSAVAEVGLIFDNGSGALPLDYEQIEVTRRLTRDTGSEYRLNGNPCRLLDVQDLVGGLGLGREMHSVISQGKVEALLNSTPEARRAMVEEAAGLARFKKRRERAQTKLERTRQNLLRVGDIEREVKTALRPLRRQVEAAERFAEATEQWALAKARLLIHSLIEVGAACDRVGGESDQLRMEREQIEASLADLRQRRLQEEEQFDAALKSRETITAAYHQVRVGAEHMASRTVSLRQRLVRTEGELDRAKRRLDLARTEAASLASLAQAMKADTGDETRLHRVSRWVETLQSTLDGLLPEYRAAAAEEDDLKDVVFELEAGRSRALQDREFLRREVEERGRVGAQLATLADEVRARLEQLEAEDARMRIDLEAADIEQGQAEQDLDKALAARNAARDEVDEISRREAALAETLSGIESRLTVLTGILARREGAPAGVRRLLDIDEECRLLTDALTVEPGYERAVAAALGPLIEAVVFPAKYDLARAFRAEGALEAIRESEHLISKVSEPEPPAGTRDLWEVVSGPEGITGTLRMLIPPTAVIADDRYWKDCAAGGRQGTFWRLVSLKGELLCGEVHAARRQDAGAEALLKARNELEKAGKEREALLSKINEVHQMAERAASAADEAENLFRQGEERRRRAERQVIALRGEIDLVERRLEETRLQSVEVQGRRDRESAAVSDASAELRVVEESLERQEAELDRARADLRAHQVHLEGLRTTIAGLEEKKGRAALLEVKLRERCRSREAERSRALSQCDAAGQEVVRCARRVDSLGLCLPVLTRLLETAERLAGSSLATAASLESRVDAARAASEAAARDMRDRGGEEADLQRQYDALGTRLADLRVERARLDDRRMVLEEELVDLRRRHQTPRALTTADVAGEDAAGLEAAVQRAEQRRDKIGPVNPLAEVECAEMEERATFLMEQRRDLETSLAQLQEVIRDLDGHIERTFAEVFEATRIHFSAVVASVFPGAKGSLKLTEVKRKGQEGASEEESAESGATVSDSALDEDGSRPAEQVPGIALEVKFPNKSPRSLSLLSGGEKAMTAIAFLFSLFLARPCPFYILDEVEASLDDINIRRFLSLIAKYRDKAQFIIITHQRQTMEVADVLYGVTLESDGTSRVLSRRLAIAKGA